MFFLHDETFAMFGALEAPNVYFLGYGYSFDHDDGYSVNSRFNRVWLPATDEGGTSGADGASGDNQRVWLGPSVLSAIGSEGATGAVEVDDPTITLAKIKDKIAFIEAEISRGDGSAEYESCVHSKYLPLREDTSGSSRGSIHHQKHLFRDD